MGRYNIAQFGTFDLENYGDLLFPFVLEKSLKADLEINNIVLFSPIGGKMPFTGSVDVYPIDKFEVLQKKYHFDAVIIGGGDLIRFDRYVAKKEKYNTNYAAIKLWVYPALVAEKYGIPLIWNCPGVPFPFNEEEIGFASQILKAVDYIAVRDEQSKQFLSVCCNPDKISVYPDSVVKISSLISLQELKEIREGLRNRLNLPDKDYLVCQIGNLSDEHDQNNYVEALLRIEKEFGLEIVLMPIGYVHNDIKTMQQIFNCASDVFYYMNQKLTPLEMLSVITGSQFFIGSGLHGNITAYSYGIKSIAMNYGNLVKISGFFNLINYKECVVYKSSELYKTFTKVWNQTTFDPQDTIQKVEEHVANMEKVITAGFSAEHKSDSLLGLLIQHYNNIYELSSLKANKEAEFQAKLTQKEAEFQATLAQKNNEYHDNIDRINKKLLEKDSTIKKINEELTSSRNQVVSLITERDKYLGEYLTVTNSTCWKITKPLRFVLDGVKKALKSNRCTNLFYKGLVFLKNNGIRRTIQQIKHHYKKEKFVDKKELEIQRKTVFPKQIKFSILVPLYNTPKNFLEEMIDSVQNQTYGNWELCVADGSDEEHNYVGKICRKAHRKDSRIRYRKLKQNMGISENTNKCIEMSAGDYIGLLDHDDILHPSALFEAMKAICEKGADFIYTDENTFSKTPKDAYCPNFKPDFAPDTLRSLNYICHFTAFDRNLLKQTGLYRKEFDGSQDYDMVLRLTEKAEQIVHIPKILYYWRAHSASVASDDSAKPYVVEAAKKALAEHLDRVHLKGTVANSTLITTYKINYQIEGNPLISIMVPNKDHIEDLQKCIASIQKSTTYSNYEIVIIENNSTEDETFAYYKKLQADYRNIKVITWDGPFNYSAINNFGFQQTKGEYILLLNNDIEIITPDWLQEMLMFAQRKDVGAVGAMLYYPDNTIQHAGVIVGLGGVAGHSHKFFKRGVMGYMGRISYAQNLSAVTGACMMLSRSVYEEMHGLDESFEVAFNDVDLCMRIRKAGYLIVFTPYAELYHYESKSRGYEDTPEKKKRFEKEVLLFKSRWKKELEAGDPYYNPNFSLETEDFSIKRELLR